MNKTLQHKFNANDEIVSATELNEIKFFQINAFNDKTGGTKGHYFEV